MAFIVTVSQINRRLSLLLKGDKTIQNLSVRGEISNFKYHTQSGHMYFTLCDETASIKVVMFKSYADKINIELDNGMNVIVTGAVQLYERDGVCQLYAYDIKQEEGIGSGALSFEQLKNKLNEEGLFNQKRPLPDVPKSICIVTSETGAAIRDIMNVLSRRYPFVKVKLIPVLVQGSEAPLSIAEGIKKAQTSKCDLIIFGRGGGSSEDLSAFNAEIVARAVYSSKIPTISAVGHEIDFSISDFVADMRAPTPSAAAEIAVPDINEMLKIIENKKERIKESVLSKVSQKQLLVNSLFSHIESFNPVKIIEANEKKSIDLSYTIKKKYSEIILKKELRLKSAVELMSALNPFNTLNRGYSIIYKDNAVISSAKSVEAGDKIKIMLSDGELNAVITD